MKKVAILGSTGYVGRSLSNEFINDGEFQLFLFYRSIKNKNRYFKNTGIKGKVKFCNINKFNLFDYDIIINATGVRDPAASGKDPIEVFNTTEKIDNIVINYLKNKKRALYVNMSSGAVYGSDFNKGVDEKTKTILDNKNFKKTDFYSIAKINSEAKHRSLGNFNIVDIRIFGFFSRFIDINDTFLMSEVVDCIKNNKVFITDNYDIVRDYVTTKDLFNFIKLIIKKKKINTSFDIYSKKPINKLKLISTISKKYNLKFSIVNNKNFKNKNKQRKFYFSNDRKASILGYKPLATSLDGIIYEIDCLLSK